MRNIFIFLASLYFYAWGEPSYVYLMLFSICFNYIIGLCISDRKEVLVTGVFLNLLILFVFKYEGFIVENINHLLDINLPSMNLPLPIGISFFTFQAISYLIDVYRKDVPSQKNPINLGLYISLFPQLIAGPIVRYTDIEKQINQRSITWAQIDYGVKRFIEGLAKKVILANNFAIISEAAFASDNLSTSFAWLGAIAYTLQIYYDFSGYSDMAIGLGRIFGFTFAENFNYPYIAKTVSEFWRRWHISLGSFFRDYVYFPLGGSRVSRGKLRRNLFIVWALTGLWHGAAWQFLAWGMLYFILILVEKELKPYFNSKIFSLCYQIYTMFFVIIGWIIFAQESLTQAMEYIIVMLGAGDFISLEFYRYLNNYYVLLIIGIIFTMPVAPMLKNKLKPVAEIISPVVYIAIFLSCVSYLVIGAHNPFIYFNF
ncbi:MBOAT family O-acyltransferase [Candidatus Epulonipiscium viviparus]|uniref:MBOAT family O-acyltransferase n=2 Tax=Candidatus Epulonipiscium viviparus TaxID=420336 RepID=UPI002B1BD7CF|nr:MBOAT family O-acyltransferase [Candidatus Epulopiscium viviparus]